VQSSVKLSQGARGVVNV